MRMAAHIDNGKLLAQTLPRHDILSNDTQQIGERFGALAGPGARLAA
jgi:hypothetical protein